MLSDMRFSGIMPVFQKENRAVSNYGRQEPPEGIGVDTFDFWTPEKMPAGKNIAMTITPPLSCFRSLNLKNSQLRPDFNWASELLDS